MALINQNSIIGVTSITSPSASNVLTVHTNDTTERLRVSTSGVSFSGTNASLDTSGNLTIAGVLTYEDVTSVDSVGIITAQSGIKVLSGGANITGIISTNNGLMIGSGPSYLYESGTDAVALRVGSNGPYAEFIDAGSNILELGNASGHLALTSNGTEKVRITSDGKIGITATVPLAKVHITGSATSPCLVLPDTTNPRYSVGFGNINVSGVGQRLDFYTGDSGSNTANLTSAHRRMSLTAQGRLGIGTDNPNNPLTIHASGNHIYLKDTATDNNLQIRSSGGVAEFNSFGTSGARRDFVFNQYTSEVLRITSGGNIGIGTTNPGSKLAVHGSITESTDGVTYYPVVTQQDVGLDQNQIPLNQNLGGMAYMDTSNYEQVFEIPATDVTSYFKEGTENIYIGMEGHAPSSVAWPSGSLNQIDVWEIDFQLTYPNMTSGRNDLWMLMYYHNGSSITQATAVEWNNWVLARTSYAGTNTGWNQIQSASSSNWGKLANYMDAKLFTGKILFYRGGTNDFTGSNAGQRTGVMWQFNYTHGGVGSTLAFGSGHPTTPSPSQPLAGFTLNADPENAGTVNSDGNSQVFGGYIRQRGFRLQGNI